MPSTTRLAAMVAVLTSIAALLVGFARWPSASQPGATALEATLLAPCCYGGTLDIHDSELARSLRKEIETRVERGESTTAIEADMVERYGPRIRAMPSPGRFSATILGCMGAIVLGGVGVLLLSRRWRSAERRIDVGIPGLALHRDEYDDRLDAELREFE